MRSEYQFHHTVCKEILGDKFQSEIARFKDAVLNVEAARGKGVFEAASSCASVAIKRKEEPIIACMFFAAAVEIESEKGEGE